MNSIDSALPPLTGMLDLGGRTAVVTGAAGGLGAAIANRLVEAGARVGLIDVAQERLDAFARRLADAGGEVLTLPLDVTDTLAVENAVDHVCHRFGALDAWVNNAGIAPRADVLSLAEAEWDAVQAVNLRAAFVGARAAARRMIADGRPGVIVNMASSTVHRVSANSTHYRVSKAGLVALTQSLAVELGVHGIRVVSVAPTLVQTPAVERLRGLGLGPDLDRWASHLPLGRAASPDEVARVVLFAISDLAAFMTGCVLDVDGGETRR